ncbi:Myc-type, basic helix-loop-helix domain-containing protein, partial [Dichotomocladium elegans]
ADEREQARRVSHSAIERRRRERINDKIIQLRQLIPSCADQEHLNKVTILQSAIDYISYLKKMAENKDGGALAESLKIDSLKIQSPRSMVPKEVAPFTTQFAV